MRRGASAAFFSSFFFPFAPKGGWVLFNSTHMPHTHAYKKEGGGCVVSCSLYCC
jgi:hypothetical protein